MTGALLRKELRLASDVAAGALVLFAASFPLACAGVAMQGVWPFPWVSALVGGCVLNQYTLVLTGALLGAVAFAREREEGANQFLAALPLPPGRHFAVKVAGGVLLWAALWAVNGLLLVTIVILAGFDPQTLSPFIARMLGTLALSWAAFGMAACAGTQIASVTGAALAGAAGLMAVAVFRLLLRGESEGVPFFSGPFIGELALLGAGLVALARLGMSHARVGRTAGQRPGRKRAARQFAARGGNRIRTALLWKDYRLMRTPVLLGTTLFTLPFVAAVGHGATTGNVATAFRSVSLLSMALAWVILPFWSGSSIAGEWAAGTDAFLAGLPLRRTRTATLKFLVAAVPASLLCAISGATFLLAQSQMLGEPSLNWDLTWENFNASHFLPGAVAYACAQPITFAVAWYVAARTRRKTLAIVVGIIAGPVAMATWAVTGGTGGFLAEHWSPVPATALHALILTGISGLLVLLGVRAAVR